MKNVLSCGGTTMTFKNNKRQESCWSQAGCGISKYVSKPQFQSINILNTIKKRSTPDISALADPITGVPVFYNNNSFLVGGTSLSCPIIAGILSLVVQARINKSKTLPISTVINTPLNIQTILYNLYKLKNKTCFYDIISGNSGFYKCSTGFDIATGIGSLNVANFVKEMENK
jgi:subtilase family serine protease